MKYVWFGWRIGYEKTVHVPLMPSTHHLIGTNEFKLMKQQS